MGNLLREGIMKKLIVGLVLLTALALALPSLSLAGPMNCKQISQALRIAKAQWQAANERLVSCQARVKALRSRPGKVSELKRWLATCKRWRQKRDQAMSRIRLYQRMARNRHCR